MSEPMMLVATRLKAMQRIHPAQSNEHCCSQCGERVGIYPSGQKALKANPGMTIVCSMCALADMRPQDQVKPAGSWVEIVQESRDSQDVGKA